MKTTTPRALGPVRDKMFHLELMITRQCGLECTYCQVDRKHESMAPEILRRSIDLLMTSRSDEVDLLFYGGEPLERPDLVREAVDLAERRAGDAGKRVRYILITNGLHLDQGVLERFPAGRLQVYLNLVGFSTPREGRSRPAHARLSSQTLRHVAMLENAGVWQCANLVADPSDLGTMRAALEAAAEAGLPRLQVFFRLGVEWPEAAAAELLDDIGRMARRTGAPRLFNAEERMAPFLLHNDAVVDCDGEIYWSAGIWLEQGFPELKQACRIGRVGETADFDALWRSNDEVRRILLDTYPPGSPRGRILRNNVALGEAFCRRVEEAVSQGSAPTAAGSPRDAVPSAPGSRARARPVGRDAPEKAPQSFFLCSTEAGCPVNLSFTTQLHNYIAANHWAFQDLESADHIVIVNCSTVPDYRRRVPATVEYLAERYPSKSVVVAGCFVDQDRVAAPNVKYVPETRKEEFDRLFNPTVPLGKVSPVSTDEEDSKVHALRGRDKVSVPYNVTVATGCRNHCAFCIQKNIFTSVKSVPIDEIVSRCRDGLRKGYTHFIISGADVCSYGHDLGRDVTDLFAALFDEVVCDNPNVTLAFHAFEPSGFIRHFAKLRPYFKEGRIRSIRLPIQSGSDAVIRSMSRQYRVEDVMHIVAELRLLAPAMRIDTDLLFCYPTETSADFDATLALVDHFDEVSLLVFGRHEDTKAYGLEDVFDAAEKARRCKVLESTPQKQSRRDRDGVLGGHAIEIQLPSAQGASRFFMLPKTASPQSPYPRQSRPDGARVEAHAGAAPIEDRTGDDGGAATGGGAEGDALGCPQAATPVERKSVTVAASDGLRHLRLFEGREAEAAPRHTHAGERAASEAPVEAVPAPAVAPDDADTLRLRQLGQWLASKGLKARLADGRLDVVFPDSAQDGGMATISLAKATSVERYYKKTGDIAIWFAGRSETPRIAGMVAVIQRFLTTNRRPADQA